MLFVFYSCISDIFFQTCITKNRMHLPLVAICLITTLDGLSKNSVSVLLTWWHDWLTLLIKSNWDLTKKPNNSVCAAPRHIVCDTHTSPVSQHCQWTLTWSIRNMVKGRMNFKTQQSLYCITFEKTENWKYRVQSIRCKKYSQYIHMLCYTFQK